MVFELTSAAFAAGEPILLKYTCDGDDVSPPLAWTEPPAGTQSLALICDDPDAPVGTWVHWVLYNLPAEARALPEAVPAVADLPDGGRHGNNSWRRLGYGGPCPPSGTHRYFFKLYALDTALDLAAGASKKELLGAMEGHVLAQAELMGVYSLQ
jgi:Raf kinase inhibitor-like YbhB/YbcL family protein